MTEKIKPLWFHQKPLSFDPKKSNHLSSPPTSPKKMSIWRQYIDATRTEEVTQYIPHIDICLLSLLSRPIYAGPLEVPDVSDACYAKRSGWPLSC